MAASLPRRKPTARQRLSTATCPTIRRCAPSPCWSRRSGTEKKVAVPKCYGDEMKFIYLDDLTKVAKGYAGIPEPIADEPVAHDETALVLMPGLAFDPQGHRIGYGGGFYDKFLSREPNHPTLALCYDFQMLPHLDTEEHDIPVDTVLWA